jgi:hypothetical protein
MQKLLASSIVSLLENSLIKKITIRHHRGHNNTKLVSRMYKTVEVIMQFDHFSRFYFKKNTPPPPNMSLSPDNKLELMYTPRCAK